MPSFDSSPFRPPLPLRIGTLAALGVLSIVTWTGCGSTQPAPQEDRPPANVVATFAGETLTFDELKTRYERSLSGEASDSTFAYDAYQDFLDRYVNFRLKVLDARTRGLDRDSATVVELENYRQQLARPYLVERQVMDSLIQDLYEKQEIELKAGHILVLVPPGATPSDTLSAYRKIRAIHDSLVAGGDFSELAVLHSEDPSAAQNEGILGYFTGGRLIYRFEDQAYATPVGTFSEPFRTQFGYHIVKVFDRRPYHPAAQASHILISTQDKSPEEALETATMLKERIAAGEDFATLARQYSNDPGSAQNGGELGMIPHGRTVPPFEEALFALDAIGAVSDPVQTRFGYHLIKLTDLQDRPAYEDAYPELKNLVTRLPRLRDSELRIGRQYRNRLGSSLDTLALDRVLDGFPEDSLYFYLRATDLDSAYLAVEIGRIADVRYDVAAFRDFLLATRPTPPPANRAELYRLVNNFLDTEAVNVAAARLEDLNPEFAALMREYEEGILLFAISEDSVWDAAARDTVALRRIYAANREAYTYPTRKRVISLTANADSVLRQVKPTLDAGADLETALARTGDLSEMMRIDTTFVADSTQSLYDQALGLSPGESTAILPFQNRRVLLYVDGIEQPRPKTFEEARAEIIGAYQSELETAWVDRLRDRYDVRTYPEHLRLALQAAAAGTGSPAGGATGSADR